MDRTQAVATLKAGVAKLATSEAFQEYLEVRARFHNYSFRNCILIQMQCPGATVVAGFSKWLTMGRAVRKGEKSLKILAPLMFAKKDPETGEKTGELLRGFRVVSVFDLGQTDGKPLPAPEMPKQLEGSEDAGIFDALHDFTTRAGLTVQTDVSDFPDERNGDYTHDEKRIRIRAGLSPLQRAKTFAHECGHWILHTSPEGSALPREVKETEAEATAFLVLARLGLRADAYSFAYVAHWAQGDMKVLESSLARIEKATEEILHAIECRKPEMAEPQDAALLSVALSQDASPEQLDLFAGVARA